MNQPPFRSLRIVDEAIEIVAAVDEIAEALPSWRYYLKDQVRRAVASVAFNFSEGGAETALAEKARFYRIALRSIAELDTGMRIIARLHPNLALEAERVRSDLVDLTRKGGSLAMSTERRFAASRRAGLRHPHAGRRD